jgi:BMFP domain-containing protein YqiC
MQTRSRFFDDLSQLMTNAAGVAQGARNEAETAMRGWFERFLADSNLVTREEFEAVREMAIKAREENERLANRIRELETMQPASASPAGPDAAGELT